MVEPIVCGESNLINLEDIIKKINELIDDGNEFEECCDELRLGTVIRAKAQGTRLFITSDGSAPNVAIPLPDPIPEPLDSFMNTVELDQWIFNTVDMIEVYFDGELVFYRTLYLELPQYTTQINLANFINANNPDNLPNVIVTNNLIQPEIISGNVDNYNFVGLVNNGEFQGLSSSGTAMTLTSTIKLTNNGWIRGAGGDGGDGGGANSGSGTGGIWTTRHHTAPTCVPNGVITPRYWNEGANMEWRPKTGTQCASTTKGPYTTNGPYDHRSGGIGWYCITSWGDQGKVVFKAEAFGTGVATWRWRNGQSSGGAAGSIDYQVSGSWSVTGGVKGIGGAGQGFRVSQDAGWKAGVDASFSGDYGVFNTSNGETIVASAASLKGYDGGHGGAWAEAGGTSENGNAGQPAGKAIVGVGFLAPDSDTGNTNGVIE